MGQTSLPLFFSPILFCLTNALFFDQEHCPRLAFADVFAHERPVVPWLNWIEQPPPKGQVAGSNPAWVTKNFRKFGLFTGFGQQLVESPARFWCEFS